MPREATLEDMPTLLVYGWRFVNESGYSDLLEFDPERLEHGLRQMIESSDALLLIADKGFAAVMLVPMYFSSDLIAQELFWWVSPESRGNGIGQKMKIALEEWAANKGAKVMSMSALEPVPKKIIERYREAGYRPTERNFMRGL